MFLGENKIYANVGAGCFLIQPVGIGFVMAKPYWLFSAIFKILAIILVKF